MTVNDMIWKHCKHQARRLVNKIIKLCSASRMTFRAWFYRTDPQNIGGQFGTLSGFLRNTFRKRTSQKSPEIFFRLKSSRAIFEKRTTVYSFAAPVLSLAKSIYYNADLDGYYRRYVRYIRENVNPVDLALYGDNLYWVDKNSRSIHWFKKTHPVDMLSFGHLTNGILVSAVVSDETRQPVGKLTNCVIALGICHILFGVLLFDSVRFFAPCLYARVGHRTHFTQFYLTWALVGNALDECLIKEIFIISR